MKQVFIFFFLLLGTSVFSQKIENGTFFTIQFNNLQKGLGFKIVSKKSFNQEIDISKMDVMIKDKPKENQITGVFGIGKFGDKISTVLVLVSGVDALIDYDLMIKAADKRKFIKTSVSSLFKNVKSIEYWPYPIDKIEFAGFRSLPIRSQKTFDIEVATDSVCIKNTNKNIESGELEFKSYLKTLLDKFEKEGIDLVEAIAYEKNIGSEDKSLGHYWSIGEKIYPNEKAYNFGDPISYRRLECPYFEGTINYFYTKDKNEIKVVSYSWNIFKESNFGMNPEIVNDVDAKFDEKLEYIVNTVSLFLGAPIENITDEDGQRHFRWANANGLNACMYNFGNYNEINLYIYKD